MLLFRLLGFFVIGTAFAQRIVIAYPPNGTNVRAGSTLTVELDQPVNVRIFESMLKKLTC